MKKKGSSGDMLYFVVLLLIMGILILVASYVKDQAFPVFITEFGRVGGQGGNASAVLDTIDYAFTVFDYVFLFITFMLGLTPIITSFVIDNPPLLLFINIIVLTILLVISPMLSNVMESMWSQPQFSTYETEYPIMLQVFKWLPLIMAGIGFIFAIATFGKPRGI